MAWAGQAPAGRRAGREPCTQHDPRSPRHSGRPESLLLCPPHCPTEMPHQQGTCLQPGGRPAQDRQRPGQVWKPQQPVVAKVLWPCLRALLPQPGTCSGTRAWQVGFLALTRRRE